MAGRKAERESIVVGLGIWRRRVWIGRYYFFFHLNRKSYARLGDEK